jgi:hypothetical protein
MSIKRSSKSGGTAVRKPTTSPGVRHVDVVAPRQMVSGDMYSGWVCKNKSCGLVMGIPVAEAGEKTAVSESDDQLVVIKCPHCADENLYRLSARGEHKYAAPNA